ncbi:MAG TPA: hypothetical protein VF898_12570, partial [Chloroflexota bacterium]
MNRLQVTLVAIAVVVLCAIYIDLPGTTNFFGASVQVKKGLDLAGGARLLMCTNIKNPSSADMDTAANVMRNRAAGGL